MKPFIDYLLEHESAIYACKAWVDHRYLSPDEMIPGVEIQGVPYLVDLMADPEMETLSF